MLRGTWFLFELASFDAHWDSRKGEQEVFVRGPKIIVI
jgi:hypothetical protein